MLDPELDGSLVALGRALLEHGTRRSIFQRALAPPQTLEEVKVLSIFLVFQAVILVVLPGRRFTGPVAPSGHTPSYRENGLLHFAITLGGYFLVTHKLGLLPAGWIYDHLRQVMWILNVFGLLLSAALYVKGLYAPSTPDSGSSGNIWMDFYWGTELYPRVFGVDLKQVGGWLVWRKVEVQSDPFRFCCSSLYAVAA